MDTERAAIEMKEKEQDEAKRSEAEGREDSIRREYGFAEDVSLKECRYCRVMIPKKAKICPNCRMHLKRRWLRNLAAAVVSIAVIGVGGYYLLAYQDVIRDTVSVWAAQDGSRAAGVSVTTVGATQTAAGAEAAEAPAVITEQEKKKTPSEEADSEQEKKAATSGEADAEREKKETAPEEADSEQKIKEQAPKTAAGQGEKEAAPEDLLEPGEKDSMPEGLIAQGKSDPESGAKTDGAQERSFREECKAVGYKTLLRDEASYLETPLLVEAQVLRQINGGLFDDNVYYFCEAEDNEGIIRYYIVRDDREEDTTLILEGDRLMVYGQLFGSCKIPADLMETRPTVPAVSMFYYDLIGE